MDGSSRLGIWVVPVVTFHGGQGLASGVKYRSK